MCPRVDVLEADTEMEPVGGGGQDTYEGLIPEKIGFGGEKEAEMQCRPGNALAGLTGCSGGNPAC